MPLAAIAAIAAERVENELFDWLFGSGGNLWLRVAIAMPLGIAFFVYAMRGRSGGVAVVLDLNDGWGPGRAEEARAHALKNHRPSRVTVVTQDLSNESGDARTRKTDLAHSAFQTELRQLSKGESVQIALYPVARLHDAFNFGRGIRLDSHDYSLVYSRDTTSDTERHRHVLRLDLDLTKPLTTAELAGVEEHLTVHSYELDPTAPADHAALIVALTDPDQMVAAAKKAVHTGDSKEYRVGPEDQCRSALAIAAPGGHLDPAALPFELVVRYIRHRWDDFLREHGNPDENRILLKCPAIVAMALGSVLGLTPIKVITHIHPHNSHR